MSILLSRDFNHRWNKQSIKPGVNLRNEIKLWTCLCKWHFIFIEIESMFGCDFMQCYAIELGHLKIYRKRNGERKTHAYRTHIHIKSNKMCVNCSICLRYWSFRLFCFDHSDVDETDERNGHNYMHVWCVSHTAAPMTIATVVAEVFVVGLMFANQECHSFLFSRIGSCLHTHTYTHSCRSMEFVSQETFWKRHMTQHLSNQNQWDCLCRCCGFCFH